MRETSWWVNVSFLKQELNLGLPQHRQQCDPVTNSACFSVTGLGVDKYLWKKRQKIAKSNSRTCVFCSGPTHWAENTIWHRTAKVYQSTCPSRLPHHGRQEKKIWTQVSCIRGNSPTRRTSLTSYKVRRTEVHKYLSIDTHQPLQQKGRCPERKGNLGNPQSNQPLSPLCDEPFDWGLQHQSCVDRHEISRKFCKTGADFAISTSISKTT